jgi:riboflavin transporter FmnP
MRLSKDRNQWRDHSFQSAYSWKNQMPFKAQSLTVVVDCMADVAKLKKMQHRYLTHQTILATCAVTLFLMLLNVYWYPIANLWFAT